MEPWSAVRAWWRRIIWGSRGLTCGSTVPYTNRTVVERLWARLKEWRAIVTRYEKTASSFMGVLSGVLSLAALDWLMSYNRP